MAIEFFRNWRPDRESQAIVSKANEIIADMQSQGYVLTLRQLYYQFVSLDLIPNTEKMYKRLGVIITSAREAGMMDWTAIEDRGRTCYFHSYESDAESVLRGIEVALGIDPWADQDTYLEVWIEKQALESVIARPARKRRVPYMACKGYLSASEAYRAGKRFQAALEAGKRPVLLHLGDHDPSGKDMTRDNDDRMDLFTHKQGVEVRRLALNMDQIKQYNPPPNPAKTTDSRHDKYAREFGSKSWELDALQPRVIDGIITSAIDEYVDADKWAASMAQEQELRKPLALLAPRWKEVLELVSSTEKPLERLKGLDALLPQLPDLMIRSGSRLMAEGLFASAGSRVAGIEDIAAIDNPYQPIVLDNGADNPEHGAFGEALKKAKDAVSHGRDTPPSAEAKELQEKLADAADALGEAMMPVPTDHEEPEVDNDYEPEDPEADDQPEWDTGEYDE